MFKQCLDILYFVEKINCSIDAFDDQLIITYKVSKQAMCVYLLCYLNHFAPICIAALYGLIPHHPASKN